MQPISQITLILWAFAAQLTLGAYKTPFLVATRKNAKKSSSAKKNPKDIIKKHSYLLISLGDQKND